MQMVLMQQVQAKFGQYIYKVREAGVQDGVRVVEVEGQQEVPWVIETFPVVFVAFETNFLQQISFITTSWRDVRCYYDPKRLQSVSLGYYGYPHTRNPLEF